MKKCLLIVIGMFFSTPGMANVIANGALSLNHNDNLPNAAGSANVFSDSYGEGTFRLGKLFNPAVGRSILVAADVETRSYQRTKGLNRLGLGGVLSYTHRMGLGAYAPKFNVSIRTRQFNYKENLRDGWTHDLSVGFEKRFTPALRVETGFHYEKREAKENNAVEYHPGWNKSVFFQENRNLTGAAEYTFENYSSLTLRYRYRDGEADTSVRPGSSLSQFSKAIAFDPAMGSDYIAYLLDSSSHSVALSWSYPLGKDSAFSFSYEKRKAKVAGNIQYRSNILSTQFTLRF